MSAFVLKLIKPICSFLSYHPQRERLRDCSRAAVRARGVDGAHARCERAQGVGTLRCADAVCDVSAVRALAYT